MFITSTTMTSGGPMRLYGGRKASILSPIKLLEVNILLCLMELSVGYILYVSSPK